MPVTTITFSVDEDYPICILLSIWIAFQCTMVGFTATQAARSNALTSEWLEENFGEEHRKAFPEQKTVAGGGYPDMGNGCFSQKLSYKKWYDFNCAIRSHANFVESENMVCVSIL